MYTNFHVSKSFWTSRLRLLHTSGRWTILFVAKFSYKSLSLTSLTSMIHVFKYILILHNSYTVESIEYHFHFPGLRRPFIWCSSFAICFNISFLYLFCPSILQAFKCGKFASGNHGCRDHDSALTNRIWHGNRYGLCVRRFEEDTNTLALLTFESYFARKGHIDTTRILGEHDLPGGGLFSVFWQFHIFSHSANFCLFETAVKC